MIKYILIKLFVFVTLLWLNTPFPRNPEYALILYTVDSMMVWYVPVTGPYDLAADFTGEIRYETAASRIWRDESFE